MSHPVVWLLKTWCRRCNDRQRDAKSVRSASWSARSGTRTALFNFTPRRFSIVCDLVQSKGKDWARHWQQVNISPYYYFFFEQTKAATFGRCGPESQCKSLPAWCWVNSALKLPNRFLVVDSVWWLLLFEFSTLCRALFSEAIHVGWDICQHSATAATHPPPNTPFNFNKSIKTITPTPTRANFYDIFLNAILWTSFNVLGWVRVRLLVSRDS